MASSRSFVFHSLLIIIVLLSLVLFSDSIPSGAASRKGDITFVRIYSARVADGPAKTNDELKVVARARGSEEVANFHGSEGPEHKLDIWTLRPGHDGYAYPGFTPTLRTHFDNETAAGALAPGVDGNSATEDLPCWDEPVEWVFPLADDAPLVVRVFESGRIIGTISVFEKPSPAGGHARQVRGHQEG